MLQSDNFRIDEFLCNCGCGMDIEYRVKAICYMLREICDFAIIVNSGARCSYWNRECDGSETSSHLKGLAVDIKFKNSFQKFMIISTLMMLGVRRIGINENKKFIHFDLDDSKPQDVLFTY